MSGFQEREGTAKSTVLVMNLKGDEERTFINTQLRDVWNGYSVREIKPTVPLTTNDTDAMIRSIKEAVRKEVIAHGTIAELRFGSHARPFTLLLGKEGKTSFSIDKLINALGALQEETGVKIADKISFLGCDTFSQLSPERTNYLRNQSVAMRTELVGTTTTTYTNLIPIPGLEDLSLISFKDGKVGHFTASNHNLPSLLRLIDTAKKYDNTWIACHVGHTQEEGEDCQLPKKNASHTKHQPAGRIS